MSTVADAARPVGAYPPPVRHGTCRLTIRIGGMDYALKPLPPETGVLASWILRKLDHDSARYLVAAPKGKSAHCTCPDHERSGWTCKHIGALTAAGLIPAPKPSSARNRRLHARNARQAIAEARALPAEARRHLAEIAPATASAPAPVVIMPEGWQPGGDCERFAEGFRQAVSAHVARLGRGGYEICDGCGTDFDPETSGHPGLCSECAKEGDA